MHFIAPQNKKKLQAAGYSPQTPPHWGAYDAAKIALLAPSSDPTPSALKVDEPLQYFLQVSAYVVKWRSDVSGRVLRSLYCKGGTWGYISCVHF